MLVKGATGDPLSYSSILTEGLPGANCLFWTDLESVTQSNSFTSNTAFLEVNIIESANSRWRHQMEAFPRNSPFVRGIHRSPVNSPHKGPVMRTLMFLWYGIVQDVCMYIYIYLYKIIWHANGKYMQSTNCYTSHEGPDVVLSAYWLILGIIQINLYFLSLIDTEMARMIEILPRILQVRPILHS